MEIRAQEKKAVFVGRLVVKLLGRKQINIVKTTEWDSAAHNKN